MPKKPTPKLPDLKPYPICEDCMKDKEFRASDGSYRCWSCPLYYLMDGKK